MTRGVWILACLAAAALGAVAMWAFARGPGGGDRASTERVVREYLLAHPEIIPEAMERLQTRQAGQQVAANRAALHRAYPGAEAGNPRGDVTIVEFYDYACGFCRQSLADLNRLIAEDGNVRVVFRELPILSPESEAAARASLAAAEQGRFVAFHEALYAAGRPSAETIAAAYASAGVDPARAERDGAGERVTGEIAGNLALIRAIGGTGTPTWVVGDQVLQGAVGYAGLKKAVAQARGA